MQDIQYQGDGRVFERLRAVRLRPTSARICILQVLAGTQRQAMNAESIYQQLLHIGIAVSLGTIYRVLKEMELAGLLLREREASASGNKARYLIKPDQVETDSCYLVCRVCERSVLVQDAPLVEQLRQAALAHGMDIGANVISVQMRCSQCAGEAQAGRGKPLRAA
ncbi:MULTISPECIES: Fur family transcriptional regulator [Janthinobacterium]|uniref:Transcriptional repressor n=1 Tax=Janthinobacterium kumbetense TaxID=2950280 RepID=A0ABT0WWD0_9BURK|nr:MULTISPECIES: transcriptional repressor [Janthinobacterium]MCM2568355.1 transcriptional repressor [Janthinobacterium kumbetense]MDN2672511.1 transcriptional repressor [Janthinobacterium sp. SUN026]MDN2677858.1 transcriptional repressor [Janthinobacterium sp. SUN033]MDO8066919.1 transcriptional repressor [Janthinobacterium sp. SUN206]MDO8070627.1 transcriptional repressor [Janthinobacterium sp. SUN176]